MLLRTAIDLSAQYNYRSADELVEPYTYKNGIDFTRNYLDMPPIALLAVDLEAGYTHYLWGNFSIDGQGGLPDVDPLARCQYRFLLNNLGQAALIPLTSPYGPGSLWFLVSGGQELGSTGLRLGTDILLLGKDTEANLIMTPYDTSVQNAPWEFFGQFGLNLRYRRGDFDATVAPSACERNGLWWMESSFTVAYHFRSSTPIAARK